MKKEINSAAAPAAIGPYSQAIRTGNLIFVSGQLPIDAATGEMPSDIKAQTRESIKNIKAILAEEGATLDNVVKTTVFLADISMFVEMNEVYASYFSGVVTPVSMLVLGIKLAEVPLKKLFTSGRMYYTCLNRLVLFPVLSVALMLLLRTIPTLAITENMILAVFISFAMPTAGLATAFSDQ